MEPNGQTMYYKCIPLVNKNVFSCFIFQIMLLPCVFNRSSAQNYAKNKSLRILLELSLDQRARHSDSNDVNDTQIRARMQKLENFKVQV